MKTTMVLTAVTLLLGVYGLPVVAQQVPTPVATTFVSGEVVEAIELKRTEDGSALTLRGTLSNKTDRNAFLDAREISLIDFKNKKKYMVIRDSARNCVCSTPDSSVIVSEGRSIRFWAQFAAPPENVTAMSLAWPSAEPILIPITN